MVWAENNAMTDLQGVLSAKHWTDAPTGLVTPVRTGCDLRCWRADPRELAIVEWDLRAGVSDRALLIGLAVRGACGLHLNLVTQGVWRTQARALEDTVRSILAWNSGLIG